MTLSRAELERWVAYHKDWPDTMAFRIGAALLAAWDALGAAQKFIDYEVRAMLPNEHSACAPPTCHHGNDEAANYDSLDQAITAIETALPRAEGPHAHCHEAAWHEGSCPRAEGPQENPFHFCPWIKENLIGPASKCQWREHHDPRAEGEAPK